MDTTEAITQKDIAEVRAWAYRLMRKNLAFSAAAFLATSIGFGGLLLYKGHAVAGSVRGALVMASIVAFSVFAPWLTSFPQLLRKLSRVERRVKNGDQISPASFAANDF